MGKQARRKRQEPEDLNGPRHQFARALAQEILDDQKNAPVPCYVCGQSTRKMAQLARLLTREECERHGLGRSRGLIVVIICENCAFLPNAKDLVNQKIEESLSHGEVTPFDLGALSLPDALRDVSDHFGLS